MLVAIGSKARVGKDTAAAALVRDLGYTRIAFADPLKRLALETDPIIYSQPPVQNMQAHNRLNWVVRGKGGWEEAKDSYPEVRRFLQALGVGCRTVFGEDFWITQFFDAARSEKVVVPDLRFVNEAEAIRAAGGYLVKINRPGQHGMLHSSETDLDEWDDWDLVIENNRTIAELEVDIVEWARQVERRAA